jgi:hypothetical protein
VFYWVYVYFPLTCAYICEMSLFRVCTYASLAQTNVYIISLVLLAEFFVFWVSWLVVESSWVFVLIVKCLQSDRKPSYC